MEIIKIKIKTSLLDARALEQEKSSVKVGGGDLRGKKREYWFSCRFVAATTR